MVIQEGAELLRVHGALRDEVPLLLVERAIATALPAPSLVGDVDGLGSGALDNGDELDVLGAELVAEEVIDLERVVLVAGMDGTEDVDVHLVLAEDVPATHDFVEAAGALLGDAEGVVHFPRAVDAQSHEVVVLLEERGPLVVDEGAVGLHGVDDALPSLGPVLLSQLHGALVEVEAAEHRLAALPGDVDLTAGRRLHELLDVRLQRFVVHHGRLARIQVLLGEEEAVFAAKVARGAGGLGQQMVGHGRASYSSGPTLNAMLATAKRPVMSSRMATMRLSDTGNWVSARSMPSALRSARRRRSSPM